jgi:phage tail-like protein
MFTEAWMAHDTDPFTAFNFLVALGEIGGEDQISGGFQEVEGLGVSIDQVEYRVGSEKSSSLRKFPGLRRYPNVTLKRGLLTDTRLWDWINADPPDKRMVTITLLDEQRVAQLRFVLRQAWPCGWSAAGLMASHTALAVESVELTREGLEVHTG